ncbi:MAG TPA: OB-fold domain-containing protein [Pseudomonadales bacterium]|nr:OB-fold domain-containing protein [Pseudomonadales bacterium]
MSEHRYPVPEANEETEAFWAAVNESRLPIGHCRACDSAHFYPRALCPHCHSDATELRDAAGTGEIYTYSVMRRTKVPYAIGYVTLDEGVTLMTNFVDCDLDALAVGQRVQVVFVTADDGTSKVPCFTPV